MTKLTDLSWDDYDELRDPRPARHDFDAVVDRALSRRGFLGGVLAVGSAASVFGTAFGTSLMTQTTAARAQAAGFRFTPIPIGTDFAVHVPEGYAWQPLVRWGDALFSDAQGSFSPDTGVPLAASLRVFGENTDGMETFVIDGRTVLAINSEYVNAKISLRMKTCVYWMW